MLNVFLATPDDFAGHGIAEEIQDLAPIDAMARLIQILDEDPQTIEQQVARVLLPAIIAEVVPVAAPAVTL